MHPPAPFAGGRRLLKCGKLRLRGRAKPIPASRRTAYGSGGSCHLQNSLWGRDRTRRGSPVGHFQAWRRRYRAIETLGRSDTCGAQIEHGGPCSPNWWGSRLPVHRPSPTPPACLGRPLRPSSRAVRRRWSWRPFIRSCGTVPLSRTRVTRSPRPTWVGYRIASGPGSRWAPPPDHGTVPDTRSKRRTLGNSGPTGRGRTGISDASYPPGMSSRLEI